MVVTGGAAGGAVIPGAEEAGGAGLGGLRVTVGGQLVMIPGF
jgi:UPF0716 family protein affecting phage T7 exclusion